jgi:hypothetical protein
MKKLLLVLVALMAATLVIGITAAVTMRSVDTDTETEDDATEAETTA